MNDIQISYLDVIWIILFEIFTIPYKSTILIERMLSESNMEGPQCSTIINPVDLTGRRSAFLSYLKSAFIVIRAPQPFYSG